ncbi:MAG: stage III sporulation protein AF, partial [bacterium]
MPSNKFKSYINLIFGMIFIFIMLKPIEDVYDLLDNRGIGIEIGEIEGLEVSSTILGSINLEDKLSGEAFKVEDIQNRITLDIFRENIKRQIQELLNKDREIKNIYIIQEIDISLYNNSNYGVEIKEISIRLRDVGIGESREIDYERGDFVEIERVEAFVEIERIERVEIGVKEIEELNGGVEGDRQEENREEVIK